MGRAAAAGAVSGILVLGPGFRLAMRVVAIIDPATSPEFSIGGTAFLIVGFGGVMGVATGVFATLVGSGLWAENRRHPLHVNVHLGEPGTRNGVPVIWVAGTDGAEANCSDYVNQ